MAMHAPLFYQIESFLFNFFVGGFLFIRSMEATGVVFRGGRANGRTCGREMLYLRRTKPLRCGRHFER